MAEKIIRKISIYEQFSRKAEKKLYQLLELPFPGNSSSKFLIFARNQNQRTLQKVSQATNRKKLLVV
jgi:hypothetical protein